MDLLSIGRFARLSGLTVRALRHYGELGLLPPELVDGETGYRYYTFRQLGDADRVKQLRALELPLDEIGELLALGDPDAVRERLAAHRASLLEAAETTRRILSDLERLIEKEDPLMPEQADVLYETSVKELPEQMTISIGERAPLDDLPGVLSAGIDDLRACLRDLGSHSVGPPVVVYSFHEEREGIVDVEIAVPVLDAVPASGRIRSGSLPACTVLSLTHRGAYGELGRSWRALEGWLDEHGVGRAGDPREILWTDPPATPGPADSVIELVRPIVSEHAGRARGSSEKFTKPLPPPLARR